MKRLSMLMIGAIFICASAFAEKIPKSEIAPEKATVHIYRPARVVGFGWVFNVKVEGKKVAKIRNGKHMTLELNSGETELEMNNNLLPMNLEPGKHYYLRASLGRNMLLGKPEIVEVTDKQAKREIADL